MPRYNSPLLNRSMVPKSEVRGENYWYLICDKRRIGDSGEFGYLIAHVISMVADGGNWKAVHIDPRPRVI